MDERISNLEGNDEKLSKGQEYATTQAIVHCEAMQALFPGGLSAFNGGYSFVIRRKGTVMQAAS